MFKNRMRSKSTVKFKEGFTLIELLVVIAIIALLLAIVMPSLVKVKEMARRTVCAAHMKDIGQQLAIYAQNNDDWLPPRVANTNQNTLPYNHWSRWFRVDENSDGIDEYWNLGILWECGQITDNGEIFYCPSKFAKFKYEDYSSPVFPTNSGMGVRIPYTFNPECESVSNRTRRYKKITEGGSHMLLLVDLLTSDGIAHGKGWNVMPGDCSVKFKIAPEIQEIIEAATEADPDGISTDDYTSWDRILQYLR